MSTLWPLLVLFTACNCQWNLITTSTIPYNTDFRVIGYDNTNDLIWILGGQSGGLLAFYEYRLISFNPNGNIFTNYGTVLNTALRAQGRNYAQINNTLYIAMSTQLYKLNLSNPLQNLVAIPDSELNILLDIEYGCIAMNDNYIFLTYGLSLFIFNLSSNEWLSPSSINSPSLNQRRCMHSCEISSNGWLYLIGGRNMAPSTSQSHETVEKLYINDVENIDKYQWILLNQTLTFAIDSMTTVINNDLIYSMGGYTYSTTTNRDIVHVINTKNDDIFVIDALKEGTKGASAVITNNNIIYVFYEDYCQYYYANNITQNPTINPSISPSLHPTNQPTFQPTIEPTNIPTNIPTIEPTSKNPTTNPTNIPTVIPTENPSVFPTQNPSDFPASSPTILPTFEQQPSFLLDAFSPTIAPSQSSSIVSSSNNPTITPSLTPNNINQNVENKGTTIYIDDSAIMLSSAILIGCVFIIMCISILMVYKKRKHKQEQIIFNHQAKVPMSGVSSHNPHKNSHYSEEHRPNLNKVVVNSPKSISLPNPYGSSFNLNFGVPSHSMDSPKAKRNARDSALSIDLENNTEIKKFMNAKLPAMPVMSLDERKTKRSMDYNIDDFERKDYDDDSNEDEREVMMRIRRNERTTTDASDDEVMIKNGNVFTPIDVGIDALPESEKTTGEV